VSIGHNPGERKKEDYEPLRGFISGMELAADHVAPFQGAFFVRYLPRVSPWAFTLRPFGADHCGRLTGTVRPTWALPFHAGQMSDPQAGRARRPAEPQCYPGLSPCAPLGRIIVPGLLASGSPRRFALPGSARSRKPFFFVGGREGNAISAAHTQRRKDATRADRIAPSIDRWHHQQGSESLCGSLR